MSKIPFLLKLEHGLNIFELCCVILMLFAAFALQIIFNELPCPLCLLQRFGFLLATLGLLMNLRFGFRTSHYALTLLAALFSAAVSLRQIALHIIPGTGAYGDPVFGFHLYTWCFIIALLIVISTALILSLDKEIFHLEAYYTIASPIIFKPWLVNALFAMTVILIISNMIDILMICGLTQCPDNPLTYAWTP